MNQAPRQRKTVYSTASANSVGEFPQGDETLLVVERAPSTRSYIASVLESLGYAVIQVEGALEALTVARHRRNNPIDLVVVNLTLQVAGEGELLSKLQLMFPHQRILVYSDVPVRTARKFRYSKPEFPFLHSPFTAKTLAKKVRSVLDGHAKLPGRATLFRENLAIDGR